MLFRISLVNKYLGVIVLLLTVEILNLYSQDTIKFYTFDNGILDGFTTGAKGLNGAKNNRCSWWIDKPNGGRGYSSIVPRGYVGNPDPLNDHTSNNIINFVAGQGLKVSSTSQGQSGHYNNSNEWIQSPPINCSNYYNVKLTFWRWANFEPLYDLAYLEVSTNGTTWTKLPHPTSIQDTQWQFVEFDISDYADHQPLVYLRWRSESDGSIFYAGWNIDDIALTGKLNYNDATSKLELGSLVIPGKISSLIDTYSERIAVLEFSLTDAATLDLLPTLINKIKITKGTGNTISSWKKSIENVYLYGPDLGQTSGNELLGTVYDDSITFTGINFITVASNSKETYQLRIYLQTNLSNIKDNQRYDFTIETKDITENPEGSFFTSGKITSGATKLNVDIVATKLGFVVEPTQLASVSRNLSPTINVAAQDVNGNTDIDFNKSITLLNSGSLTMSGNSATALSGVATFPSCQFTQTGGPVTLSTSNTNVPLLINAVSSVSVTIETNIADYVFRDNFDNSGITGWTSGAVSGKNSWKKGVPNGGRGYSEINPKGYIGNADPTSDHTATNTINNVYGQGLSASSKTQGISSYYNSSNEWLKTPLINCSDYYNLQLNFWRWANVQPNVDSAFVEISTDGIKWIKLSHPSFPVDIAWTKVTIDISSIADRQSIVYIRWRLNSNNVVYYSGWNIDDIEITGIYSPNVIWTGSVSTDWNNPNNWSPAAVPDKFAQVTIPSETSNHPKIQTVAECNEVIVQTNASLEISTGFSLTVYGNFIIETDASNYGSLIDKGTLNVLGNCKISRYFPAREWHYFSSPVNNVNASIFGSNVFAYDEPAASDNWSNGWTMLTNENLITGKGYNIYRYKELNIPLEGKFNTGNISILLTNTNGSEVAEHEGWNLVGNPYPSVIDWDAPAGWTKQNINNAIYIWDEKLQNYVTYQNGAGANGGSNLIPPMQGFFVKVSAPGNGLLSLTNDVRVVSNQPKFKGAEDNQLIKIKLENAYYSDESVIRFIDEATDAYDAKFDADKKFSTNTSVPQIYTLNSKEDQLAINSMQQLNEYKIVPLYIRLGFAGDYTLSFSGIYDFDPGKTVYLEDLELNTLTDLRKISHYSFNATAVSDSARFLIHLGMPLIVSSSVIHVTEAGKSTGIIDLTLTGGIQPIKNITWSNGSHTEDLIGISAGEYSVTIIDGADNSYNEHFWVMQPDENGNLTSIDYDAASENHIILFSEHKILHIIPSQKNISVKSVRLIDLYGRIVFENNTEFYGENQIDLNLPTGVYVVKVEQAGKIYTGKVLMH